MRASNPVRDVFTKIASAVAALRGEPDFTCGNCERSARCSLPPSDNCIAKAEQIARGDWKLRRRARALAQWCAVGGPDG